jgi:hypothetical protein
MLGCLLGSNLGPNLEHHNNGVFSDKALTQAFARVLSRHELLKELALGGCRLGDEGIRIIADALVGNTIMETLDICSNDITCTSLDTSIMRLLLSTKLKNDFLVGE